MSYLPAWYLSPVECQGQNWLQLRPTILISSVCPFCNVQSRLICSISKACLIICSSGGSLMDNMKCPIYQPAVYLIKHWDAIGLQLNSKCTSLLQFSNLIPEEHLSIVLVSLSIWLLLSFLLHIKKFSSSLEAVEW